MWRKAKVAAGRSGSNLPHYLYLLISATIIALVALAAGFFAFTHPVLPRAIVMATGAEGGAYSVWGERYRKIFARQGVELTVLHTRGSIENLSMLRFRDFSTSIAFVQSGLTSPSQSPDLVSLGTVSIEPLWIFCRRSQAQPDRLEQLRGMRVSIGPTGSGNRSLALALLAQNGIDARNTKLLPFADAEAAEQLIAGSIDAVLIVASSYAPAVQQLLASPDIKLLSLAQANAYIARFPYLSKVVLPAGFADLAQHRPAADVDLVAVKTNLVVRRDLQSAVQYLLLEAASEIHSQSGVFQKAGEFPAGDATDLPLSESARQFYRSGEPLLQRYLPLWLAVLVEQLAITIVPVVVVAYPLLRLLPAVYDWGMRRRIYMLYGELKLLELSLEDHAREEPSAVLADLSRLEQRASHLRVPTSFAHMLYSLRQDISLVRARLDQTAR